MGSTQTNSIQSIENSTGTSLNQDQIKSQATKEWTFMVYLDADNNLEAAGIDDINEMEMEGSDANINVVGQVDRVPGYDSSNGNWAGTKRYFITKDYDQGEISSTVIQDLPETNMGDPNNLQSFIQWAKSNYPANKYALILWDHGSGVMWGSALGGVCWDDSNGDDYLSLSELSTVLSTNTVDLLGFDACLMGATEVHYQLRNYATTIVASEDIEPGAGYPYDSILGWLRTNPTANATQLAEQIVTKYNDFFSNPAYSVTQAAMKAFTNEFIDSLTIFISDLKDALISQKAQITSARTSSLSFEIPEYIDLYDFANKIRTSCNDPVKTSALQLMSNITKITVKEAHSSSFSGAHGLTIYFPATLSDYSTTYETTAFTSNFLWDEFLTEYYTGSSSSEYDDSYEVNDDLPSAKILTPGTYNLICNGSDFDFFNVSVPLGNTTDVTITFTHSEGDLNLYLYNTTQEMVDYSISETNSEHGSFNATITGYYSIKIAQTGTVHLYQPYTLIVSIDNDDVYEENDDHEQNDDWWTPREIFVNTTYTNLVCIDSDFYYFLASPSWYGWLINITIWFDYFEGDLDLYYWDFEDEFLVESSTTAANYENILTYVNESGVGYYYQFEVFNYQDNYNYSMRVEVLDIDDIFESITYINNNYIDYAADFGFGDYEDLVCINQDYYNISLTEGTWINISLYFSNDEGDIDLYLYYVLDWSPFDYNLVGYSTSYTDDEFIFYQVETTGAYYIGVNNYEINLNYTLCVHETTSIWDDSFENNDWFDVAPVINIGTSYNNLTAIDWDTYKFEAEEGYEITITLDYNVMEGDLDLYLIYYIDFFDLAYILDLSTSLSNQERIVFEPFEDGFYYLLVYLNEINMHYNLTITKERLSTDDDDDDETKKSRTMIDGYLIVPLITMIGVSVFTILAKSLKKRTKL